MRASNLSSLISGFLCILLVYAAAEAAPPPNPSFTLERYEKVIADDWYSVLFSNQKIGFTHQKIEEGKDGYRVTSRAVIRLTVAGEVSDLSYYQTFHLDKDRRVLGFTVVQKVAGQRQKTIGEVLGGKIVMTVIGAGGSQKIVKDAPHDLAFVETLSFSMAGSLYVGMKKTLPVFIASIRSVEPFSIEVTGKERMEVKGKPEDVFKITASLHGLTTQSRVTKEGLMVEEKEGMMGITTSVTTEKEAIAFSGGGVPVASLITFSLIKPDKPIPNQTKLKKITLIVSGLDTPRAIPRDERQSVGRPEWSKSAEGVRVMSLPVTIEKQTPNIGLSIVKARKGMGKYLRPTPEVQSDNREIKRAARKIVGGEASAYLAARKINRWVHENLEKKLIDSITALDVLHEKKGECNAHTNLFAALARASGIPTKITAGVVHSPTEKGFLYHAWPEVYVGQWVALDPTLGQDVADVTHIKLIEGGLEESLKLVRFIGRIGIKVR